MTVVVAKGSQLLVEIASTEDGDDYTYRCMINTDRNISFDATFIEDSGAKCDTDGNAPSWVDREVDTLSSAITGAGYWDEATDGFFYTWMTSGENRPVRWKVNRVGAPIYKGNYKLQNYGFGGGRNAKAEANVSMASDGAITRELVEA